MFILLSSDYSPRYKQDILRCLAAPIGATVQFRYDKVHISESVLEQITGATCSGAALVCSVATKGVDLLRIIPVRLVGILSTREHGSTVSVTLKMEALLQAEPESFTQSLDQLSGGKSPRKKSEEAAPEGKYFFEIAHIPTNVQQGSSLRNWEQTVTLLRDQHAYQDEPFFWTMIGLQKQNEILDTTVLHPIPDALAPSSNFDVLLYHYQPKGGQKPNSKLELTVGPDIEMVVPPDTSVDSRYDLKTWACRTAANTQATHRSWVRIRTAGTWDLDIAVSIAGAWRRWILRAIVTGILIAIPAVTAIAPQSLPTDQKYQLYAGAVLFGFLAGLVATYKIDRLD